MKQKEEKEKKIAAEKVWENESVFKVSGENELFFISIFLIILCGEKTSLAIERIKHKNRNYF